jgi:CheY-like chemotaxis protein
MRSEVIKILQVEDNPGDARLIKEMLAEAGANGSRLLVSLTHRERLEQALSLLAQEPFDLILSDLSLPDSHGLDTVRQIVKAAPTLPVIVVTSLDDQLLELQAIQAGAQDYLIKGQLDEHLLARTIRYSIERKQTKMKGRLLKNDRQ